MGHADVAPEPSQFIVDELIFVTRPQCMQKRESYDRKMSTMRFNKVSEGLKALFLLLPKPAVITSFYKREVIFHIGIALRSITRRKQIEHVTAAGPPRSIFEIGENAGKWLAISCEEIAHIV